MGREDQLQQLRGCLEADGCRGVFISGTAGIGKTRLLQEAAGFTPAGSQWVEIAASESMVDVPFGALASELAATEPTNGDVLDLLVAAHRAIEQRSREGPVVIAVDDAQLLDPASAAVLHQVAARGTAKVVATVLAPFAEPEPLEAMRRDELVDRIELGVLDRATTHTLIAAALDGPVDRPALDELWTLSEGNPLFIRELVTWAVESGALRLVRGRWTMQGLQLRSTALVDAVEQRLGATTPDERRVLEVLVVGQPLGVDILETLTSPDLCRNLERRGFIQVRHARNRVVATVAHPLQAGTLRSWMSRAVHRNISRELAVAAEGDGAGRAMDDLRVARWKLDGEVALPAAAALRLATEALAARDFGLASRLANVAAPHGGSFAAALARGQALAGLGQHDEADGLLAAAQDGAADDAELAAATLARMGNLAVADRPHAALDVGGEALPRLAEGTWRDSVAARMAGLHAQLGDSLAAADVATRLAPTTDSDERVVAAKHLELAGVHARHGRLTAAAAAVTRGEEAVAAAPGKLPLAGELLALRRVQLQAYEGDLPAATVAARAGRERALAEGSAGISGMWDAMVAWTLLWRGAVAEALLSYEDALVHLRGFDPRAAAVPAACAAAYAASQAGDGALVARYLDSVGPDRIATQYRADLDARRANAWRVAIEGDCAAARDALLETASRAESFDVMAAAAVYHDVVRLGAAEPALAPLRSLAERTEGPLVGTFAEHARALTAGDAAALDAVAVTLLAMGARLLAAEACLQAAAAYRESGDDIACNRAALIARTVAVRCRGAATAPLATRPGLLTEKEETVAFQAIDGKSSKEIATALFVSPRTVDSHLGSVYRKLGISGRKELATLIPRRVREG